MKMKLSTYWWKNVYFDIVLGIVCEIICLYFLLETEIDGESDYIFQFMLVVAILFLVVTLDPWKYLMTMEIQEKVIRSFLFGKLKCEVFLNQKVYYVIFRNREAMFVEKTYIAISNQPFICNEREVPPFPKKEKRFIDCYDRKKQIILPYNEKTKHLFEIEKWEEI